MGIAKRQWMEDEDRGWYDPETWVCRSCVGNDRHLRALIRRSMGSNACSYCGSKRRKAAPVSSLMAAMLHGVKYSYNNEANAGCPYDSDFDIEYMSSRDVLEQILDAEGLEWPDSLIADVANAFANTGWVDAPDGSWMGSHDHERLHWSWGSFADAVKHRSRFHFHSRKHANQNGDDLVTVHEMLPFLVRLVRKHRMVRTLPSSIVLHRIRSGHHPHSSAELGPPPSRIAQAGRMNPAGIPYLYLAFDQKTALAETRAKPRIMVTASEWSPIRNLQVIDLHCLPVCPSVFSEKRRKHELLQFLYKFTDEISKPVAHDGSEHIDYVPTQVISEFFSQIFTFGKGKKVDGLIYPSSVHACGRNLVLFPRHDEFSNDRNYDPFAAVVLNASRTGRVNKQRTAVI